MPPTTRLSAINRLDPALERISSLPPEIIAAICDNADPSVLKRLRLVSKFFNSLAEPALFRVVKLDMTGQSRDSLARISASEKLRHYPRVLVYDLRLLPWNLSKDAWQQRVLNNPGYHWGSTGVSEVPRDELGDLEWWHHRAAYRKYENLLEDQKAWHRGTFEEDYLTERLEKLPKLKAVFLETGVWREPPVLTLVSGPFDTFHIRFEKARQSLSTIGMISWLEPGFQPDPALEETMKPTLNQFHGKRLKAIMNASSRAELRIKSLTTDWLDLHQLSKKFNLPLSNTQESFMLGLSHFSVRLADFGCSLDAWDHATSILAHASNVIDLTAEGNSLQSHLKGRQERMDILFDKRFSKLKRLTLRGLWTDAEAFKKFVSRLPELRELCLKNVHFTMGPQTLVQEFEHERYGTLQIPYYPVIDDHALKQELWSGMMAFLKASSVAYVDVWMLIDGHLRRREDIVAYIRGTAPAPSEF